MRNTGDLESIHKHASRHRDLLLDSGRAGCFYCMAVFDPSEITDWIDGRQVETGRIEDGVTALCPRCGIDAVLPSAAPITLDDQMLTDMHQHFFEE